MSFLTTPYKPNLEHISAAVDHFTKRYVITPEPVDPVNYYSLLGTPVYSPLLLFDSPNNNFTNPNININSGAAVVDVQYTQGAQNILLRIDSCIITIRQRKEIILTKIQGRPGTIKEYIAPGDYEISVEGVIVSEYLGVYPSDDVASLKYWLTRGEIVQMTSEFLNRFDIFDVAVTEFDIPQLAGSRNQQPFRFTCLSDVPLDDIIHFSQNTNVAP